MKIFGKRFLLRGLLSLFCLLLLFGLFYKVFQGGAVILTLYFFNHILHSFGFCVVFIFDVKFLSFCFFNCSSCFGFAIFKEFKILFRWVCLKLSECSTAHSYCFFALIIVPRFIEFWLRGGFWYTFLCDRVFL